jgi:hypothetical protein
MTPRVIKDEYGRFYVETPTYGTSSIEWEPNLGLWNWPPRVDPKQELDISQTVIQKGIKFINEINDLALTTKDLYIQSDIIELAGDICRSFETFLRNRVQCVEEE